MSRHKAEQGVPEHIWRTTMHYHDLIYIKYYWETIGQHCPPHINEELDRTDRLLQQQLAEETSQGGTLYKPKGEES